MILQKNLMRKLWVDTRLGHSTYLMLLLVFLNFVLITYSYLIEGDENFGTLIPNLWLFGIVFVIFYVPISILIGRWHRQTQMHVEQDMKLSQNPVFAIMIRALLDAKTGRATKEEIEEFRKFLKEIESKEI